MDGDAPAPIEGGRRHHTTLCTRVEVIAPVSPLRLVTSLGPSVSRGAVGFAFRAELAAPLIDGGRRLRPCLRPCLGCRKRSRRDKHAQYCPHISTPSQVISK